MIDDVVTDLSQSIDVGFTSTIVAALDGVVKQTPDAVAIVGIILCRVNTPLSSNAVCATRAVLKTERFDVVAKFSE